MANLVLCDYCKALDIESKFRVELIANFDPAHPETWSISEHEIPRRHVTVDCALCRFWLEMEARTRTDHQQAKPDGDGSLKFSLVPFPVSEIYQLHEHSGYRPEGSGSLATNNSPFETVGNLISADQGEEEDDDDDGVVLLFLRGFDRLKDATYGHVFSGVASSYYGSIALCARNGAHYDDFAGELIHSDRVNWDLVRRSTRICSSHHGCDSFQSPEQAPHLKLIDCLSQCIVHASPGDRYIALSYVWGRDTSDIVEVSRVYPRLPANLPRVIHDSIAATIHLGFRYLWIDRYCIWQNDVVHKPAQIARMDLIYRNAELTLMAVAGSDPEHGLPGVGKTPRTRQPSAVISPDTKLACLMQLPMKATAESKWNTRAWTYQEAYLSPKRLYFTDEQVYYECQEMMSMESISCPLQFMTLIGDPAANPQYPWSDISRPRGIGAVITRYSSRQLTFDGDGLNAISALLSEWAARNESCYVFQGLPIIDYTISGKLQDGIDAAFVRALKWASNNDHVGDDVPSQKRRRRAGFPTWSWVCIVGRVGYWRGLEEPREIPSFPITVRVQDENGSLIALDSVLKHPSDPNNNDRGGSLHLEGYVIEVGPLTKVTHKDPWGKVKTEHTYTFNGKLVGSPGHFVFYPDLDMSDPLYRNIHMDPFDCLVLDGATLMVLMRTSEESFQRMGLLRLTNKRPEDTFRPLDPEIVTQTSRRRILLV